MTIFIPSQPTDRIKLQQARGSVLIAALIFAIAIAVALGGYLQLSNNALKLSHRTFFADAATNLAETGLEEAVWMFNTMGNSSDVDANTTAWKANGWTVGNTVADVYMTSMGSGYTSPPTVTFSGGGGSGAAGVARLSTINEQKTAKAVTVVSGITITNAGSGYTSAPTITLSGGGGTGAVAKARLAATLTLDSGNRPNLFSQLDQNAKGEVKVWVAGYDGTSYLPVVVAKGTITPYEGSSIEKTIKVILSKNGILPKGVVADQAITWSGRPFADSFLSSNPPGVPPFQNYDITKARSNTTLASLHGPSIKLSQGTVEGNVMTGPGVTVTGGTVTGEKIGNFSATMKMPEPPTYVPGKQGHYNDLASCLSVDLPRPGDKDDVGDGTGTYYYFVSGTTIKDVDIAAGAHVVIVGTSTNMGGGLDIAVSGSETTADAVASATIYMDGPLTLSGSDTVNPSSWAGALKIYSTTKLSCSIGGNAKFYGCLTAPYSTLVGNGGGNDQADLCGSFVVGAVESNGHMNFHYDESLKDLTTGKPWILSLWRELHDASDRALYTEQLSSF